MTSVEKNPYQSPTEGGSARAKERPMPSPRRAAVSTFFGSLFFPAFMIAVAFASHNAAVDGGGVSPLPEPLVNILDTDKDGILNVHGDRPVLAAFLAGPPCFALCCAAAAYWLQRRRFRREAGRRRPPTVGTSTPERSDVDRVG